MNAYFSEDVGDKKKILVENNPYNAVISLNNNLIADCQQIYQKLQNGSGKILAGLSVGIKDNINITGLPTQCGSKILKGFTSPYNATVVQKIIENDGLIVGKTNMDEFGMGSSNEFSCFGNVTNPVDEMYIPGGSSGGSAAAVAGNLVDIALGSDTGGSIRQPAAFCSIFGLKPTYGRVSRYGLVSYASSLDQIGPLSKTVEQSAKMMNVISGYDKKDSTSMKVEVPDYMDFLGKDIKNMKIGLPIEYFDENINNEIKDRLKNVIEFFKKSGSKIIKISMPYTKYAVATYYIIAMAEASSNLGRFDGIRYGDRVSNKDMDNLYHNTRSHGFGKEVKRRILLGTYVLSEGYYEAYYEKAQKIRKLIKEDFDKSFVEIDVLFTPTTPILPYKIDEKSDPLEIYQDDIFTVPANLAGVPAINVPLGNASNGLPVGGQFIGNHFDEGILFQISSFMEENYKN